MKCLFVLVLLQKLFDFVNVTFNKINYFRNKGKAKSLQEDYKITSLFYCQYVCLENE